VRPRDKARICVVFTGNPQPDDRNWGADQGQIAAVRQRLAEASAGAVAPSHDVADRLDRLIH